MITLLRPALVLFTALSLITGLLYPLLVTAVGQTLFNAKANGSLIEHNGKVVGSLLIGQAFSEPGYFWGRPSATSPNAYNAAASSGSNQGPLNPALAEAAQARIAALRAADPGNQLPIAVDLVTASASGLDPHISVAAALYQINRIARQRNWPIERVQRIVDSNIEGRELLILGEPRAHVLKLNLALDDAGRR